MNDIFNLSRLLIKKKIKALSKKEKQELKTLREKYPFVKKVDYGKIVNKVTYYDAIDTKRAWEMVEEKKGGVKDAPTISLNIKKWLKYAALFIGLIGLTFFLKDRVQTESNISSPQLQIEDKAITLQLENGKTKVISTNGKEQIFDERGRVMASQQGERIVYKNHLDSEKLVYNEISIPYGKRFQIELSDGTLVYLNSGSSLKYPVNFPKEKDRLVYLQGEAYFDVAQNLDHPFIVNAKDVDIMVTGTEFNVSCYPEDTNINTVLVEGSVQLRDHKDFYNNGPFTKIIPGELASWHRNNGKITVQNVDTEIHTGWRHGVLIFRHMKFKEILKKLERHYNITIKNNYPEINERTYTARFENNSIEHIIKSFNEYFTTTYTIYEDHIEINE